MKFNWTTLNVQDMEGSLAFYREIVGLPLLRRSPAGPNRELAFLGDGETKIELMCDRAAPAVQPSPDIAIGFEVPDLAAMQQFCQERGIAIHSGPFEPNPHIRFFFVLDPDGWRVQFVEQRF